MKNRVITCYVTSISTIISLAIAIVFTFIVFPYNEIITNVGYAVFGSSLVAFLIALIEYFQAKRYTSEKFFLEFVLYISAFGKITYFHIGDDEILYSTYLTNEKMFWKIDKTDKSFFLSKAKDRLSKEKPWVKDFSDGTFEKYFDSCSNDFEKKLKSALRTYLDFAKYQLINLGSAYNDFYFLFKNKQKRIEIFEKLYKPSVELHRKISVEASHFSDYLDGTGQNVYVMTAKLKEISDDIFTILDNDNTIKVYASKYNELSDALEEFRCNIYGQKYVKQEHTPVYSSFKNASIRISKD